VNTFCEHHKDSIKFAYRCFDRILLDGLIQPFQQPERVIGFFNAYREGQRVTRNLLRDCANWRCQRSSAPMAIMIRAGSLQRWIAQYNFYINDGNWGRMFVRVCPYLPFSARVCLNQHHWLANRMRSEGIDFKQCSNAFLKCSHPQKLQELADWSIVTTSSFTGAPHWINWASDSWMPTAPSASPARSPPSSVASSPSTTRESFNPSSKTSIYPIPSFGLTTHTGPSNSTSAITCACAPSRLLMT
jgi:hypothetical protein